METIFLGIVIFLIVLAVFDLVVGVSNDAVNFINSAIGSKAASFRIVIFTAAIGVFAGAALSNGMMDIARHGVLSPSYYSYYDVMCIFLAVMVTDVVLLDVFNSLGMPTSTTVSMVFELLGAAFALALMKIAGGALDSEGLPLTLNELLNSDKALSMILAIFLSVAVAFLFGTIVQWLSRIVFTFTYNKNARLKTSVFGGIAVTSIIWFLLIKGLKDSAVMTPELKAFINEHTWTVLAGSSLCFTVIMFLLNLLKVNILRIVVLLGTLALAMAFAGNDLVNFIGVPLAGLDSYMDYVANGTGDPKSFMMHSLNGSAKTPFIFLFVAGVIMVLALLFSKKAHNVVKTSVDLSRQDEGDEMFGSSAVARTLVRTSTRIANTIAHIVPSPIARWIDSRFNIEEAKLPQGAAFDLVRASVNLVLAGLLVALGTSLKLPLSTTYVTFMVAMGASLADRAWSRESAVFRITGVLSVIGGWFITAGVAFVIAYIVTNIMYFGGFFCMGLMIVVAIAILVRSNIKYAKKAKGGDADPVFTKLVRSSDKNDNWGLLCQHIRQSTDMSVKFVADTYRGITDAFFREEYRRLKRADSEINEARKEWKRQRRREIIGMRRIDHIRAVERNTWFFLGSNSCEQMLYCLKRINDPSIEHVGNNFTPVSMSQAEPFIAMRDAVLTLFERTSHMLAGNEMENAELIRSDSQALQLTLSKHRKRVLDKIHENGVNMESQLVYINIIQESQQLLGTLRHLVRGVSKFQSGE
ncbi:MAG: inorganic phosphate transporter [Bacteroidaceae bacterium]|nr:inorganic phosphate transporter [Bacteroidaceae bacterium]